MYCSIAAEGWLAWLLLARVVQAFHVTPATVTGGKTGTGLGVPPENYK